jgi:CMP/dCMP kinase
VLDGRDIGTVIVPEADAKLYVTASPRVRAERRAAEMRAHGAAADIEAMEAGIRARDARDMGRDNAPLMQAEDADLLDTSELTIDAAVRRAVALVDARLERHHTE